MTSPTPLLTIAGSDSGGAAGQQADLKTWTALGAQGLIIHGMSALTVITAQNSARVEQAYFLPPDLVAAQIDAVLSDYGAAAIKTGFLGRVEIIESVAERLNDWRERLFPRPFILIDPVLVNHRGESMFPAEVAAAYRRLLFPLADLITPNRHEAALLAGRPVDEPLPGYMASLGARAVLLKGLRRGGTIVDVLWQTGGETTEFARPLIDTINTHGSGDTLAAAICAFVAAGRPLAEAVGLAQTYTHEAIARAAGWRLGAGHGPLGHVPHG